MKSETLAQLASSVKGALDSPFAPRGHAGTRAQALLAVLRSRRIQLDGEWVGAGQRSTQALLERPLDGVHVRQRARVGLVRAARSIQVRQKPDGQRRRRGTGHSASGRAVLIDVDRLVLGALPGRVDVVVPGTERRVAG